MELVERIAMVAIAVSLTLGSLVLLSIFVMLVVRGH